MLKYRESRHGIALLTRGNQRAAQCVSCHGVHGIRRPSSPKSTVYPANIPATCGNCHANAATMSGAKLDDGKTPLPTDQLVDYLQSVHGKALLDKHDLGAPACNDCHGNHAAMPPAVASMSQICRNCHVNNGKLFDGSPHKAAFEKHGVSQIDAAGQTFDPAVHEAIGQIPNPGVPANTVVQVLQKGYVIHDRMVRPSRVLVSREPTPGERGSRGGD